MTNRRPIVAVLGAVVSCALLAGCGGSNSKSNPGLNQTLPGASATSASSAASSPTTASVDPASAAVLNAYRAYTQIKIQMYDKAMFDGDLMKYSSGQELQTVNTTIATLRKTSVNFTGTPNSSPTVVSVTGTTAQVHDCFGSTTWVPVYFGGPNKGKSALAQGSTVSAHPLTATLTKQKDGNWYVTQTTSEVATC